MNPASQCPWLGQYPEGVPASIDVAAFPTLAALLEASFSQFASRAALSYMGREYSYAELERQSRALAAFLQSRGLKKGDRVAVMIDGRLAELGTHDELVAREGEYARLWHTWQQD